MTYQITLEYISKEGLLKTYPTLFYGVSDKWFFVLTPDNKVCSLALSSFPNYENLLNNYKKHTLVKKDIHLEKTLTCLLAGTPLQQQVWKALLEIPQGQTISYQDLASRLKKPKAVRAIANAVGANPISPLIPCHRVIRSDGELGGYYWGLPSKIALLQKEGVNLNSLKKIFAKR